MSLPIDPSLLTHEYLLKFLESLHSEDEGTASRNASKMVDKFFTNDCELNYANYPTVQGKDSATEIFRVQFAALDGFTHAIPFFDFVAPNKLYQPTDVRYLVKGDDPQRDWIHVRAITVFWLREEQGQLKIRRADIALDVSGVTARMRSKGLIA